MQCTVAYGQSGRRSFLEEGSRRFANIYRAEREGTSDMQSPNISDSLTYIGGTRLLRSHGD